MFEARIGRAALASVLHMAHDKPSQQLITIVVDERVGILLAKEENAFISPAKRQIMLACSSRSLKRFTSRNELENISRLFADRTFLGLLKVWW